MQDNIEIPGSALTGCPGMTMLTVTQHCPPANEKGAT
jgi:hypothetical protein